MEKINTQVRIAIATTLMTVILAVGGWCITISSRVSTVETQMEDKKTTDDEKFVRLDKVVTDNTEVIQKVQLTMVKLNTTLDIIIGKTIIKE